ncbi:M48 family metallopeptidase [Kaistella palustris]|uniref:M48 family metallopeptidase n=1 Tax=Kaistella palustris TaxID=493376 RepID=UPI0005529A66|nr:SprT family zinc-dependent metalloprotease [Kaistella palustris]
MNTAENIIHYGTREIKYKLVFAERKTLGIKVFPDLSVKVTAPLESKIPDIEEKLKLKSKWILKQQDQFESYRPVTTERKYLNGETHLYLGRQYLLQVEKAESPSVKLYRGKMIVYTKDSNPKAVELIMKNWYRQKANLIFDQVLTEKLNLFAQYNITKPVIVIKWMEKRWGSCTRSGKITINTELVKAPKACIEYVMVHELCHLIIRNHTKDFYDLQATIFPDWQKWKRKLEKTLA